MTQVFPSHPSPAPFPEIPPPPSPAPNEVVPLLIGSTVGEIERELVLQTLARCDGNRTRAARVLGVSVRTLRNKIRQYSADGIDVPAHTD
jgi:DNA-binding NtrC family response regulator